MGGYVRKGIIRSSGRIDALQPACNLYFCVSLALSPTHLSIDRVAWCMSPNCSSSRCAVRAFAAFCAEYGDAGNAYSIAASPTRLPWTSLDVGKLDPNGGCARRTVEFFARFFPGDKLARNLRAWAKARHYANG